MSDSAKDSETTSETSAKDAQKTVSKNKKMKSDEEDDGLDAFLKEEFFPGQKQEAKVRAAGLDASKLLSTIKEDKSNGAHTEDVKKGGKDDVGDRR